LETANSPILSRFILHVGKVDYIYPMKTLFTHIKGLVQVREETPTWLAGEAMSQLPVLENAWLLIENDKILDYGSMPNLPDKTWDEQINLSGQFVLPAWVDSHTHLVYAGNREQEFIDRIKGLTYEEIAAKGGGIVNSAKNLQTTPEDELYIQAANRLEQVMQMGTGAIEIKSGYGLTLEAELKMLRVIKKLRQQYDLPIKATFLGAHAVPPEYKGNQKAYVDHLINEMLPAVAEQGIADYVDVFCEKNYFSVAETERIIEAAQQYGLPAKIHVNQFYAIGGIAASVKHNAKSVDHLEVLTDADLNALQHTQTMPVALPSCSFFIDIPYTPARKIIDAGLPLAIATDYNPGTTPNGNMNFCLSLACIKMKMTPEEAINAATLNAAYALDLLDTHGSITRGKQANFLITEKVPSYGFLPYSFGQNHIEQVFINGKRL
jgi:imidazolonepropionase